MFVKGEMEGFAGCCDFEFGFVRTCCRTCGDELRVPVSCKSRGCCPSCMGRRMARGRGAPGGARTAGEVLTLLRREARSLVTGPRRSAGDGADTRRPGPRVA